MIWPMEPLLQWIIVRKTLFGNMLRFLSMELFKTATWYVCLLVMNMYTIAYCVIFEFRLKQL